MNFPARQPLAALLLTLLWSSAGMARQWSHPSGLYQFEAELIGFNDSVVLLMTPTDELLALDIEELSEENRQYLAAKRAEESAAKPPSELQTWTTVDGTKFIGRVLGFAQGPLNVRRKLGRVAINNEFFSDLNPIYQRLVLKTLSQLELQTFESKDDVEDWLENENIAGTGRTYQLKGVQMQLKSGDRVMIPFLLFTDEELEALRPGWSEWLQQQASEQAREEEDFLVQASAEQYQRRLAEQQQYQQIERLKLNLLNVATGIISIWEVGMQPPVPYGRPITVMVPADNSAVAMMMARQRFPGYSIIGVQRASF